MDQEVRLEAKGLRCRQGRFVLQKVDFSLKSGDICGLLGRSGAGKSTLIKTLLGLIRADAGSVTFTKDNSTTKLRTELGYAPQDHALFTHLTVGENLKLLGDLAGLDRKVQRERSEKLLQRLRLSAAKDKQVMQLSGGMRKRADLAAALINDPSVIVLDEPFTGLDVSLRSFIWQLLEELAGQGRIILLTTHNVSDAEKHCNEYGLIQDGRFYSTKDIMERVDGDREKLSEYASFLFGRQE